MNPGFFSDAGQAEAACREALQDRFIHVHGVGWLKYNGRAWREVPDKVPLAALRAWTAKHLTAAATRGGGTSGWSNTPTTTRTGPASASGTG